MMLSLPCDCYGGLKFLTVLSSISSIGFGPGMRKEATTGLSSDITNRHAAILQWGSSKAIMGTLVPTDEKTKGPGQSRQPKYRKLSKKNSSF